MACRASIRNVNLSPPPFLPCPSPPQVHISQRKLPLAPDVDSDALAGATMGFTGADLANAVNEAALLAGRAHRTHVTRADFDAAVFR